MSRTKKILLTLLAYLTAFIAAVCVSSFVLNQGKVSGEQQRSSADLPLLYVRTGGELMNEMHGYTEPVDGGYYRDTLTEQDHQSEYGYLWTQHFLCQF